MTETEIVYFAVKYRALYSLGMKWILLDSIVNVTLSTAILHKLFCTALIIVFLLYCTNHAITASNKLLLMDLL